MLGICQTVRDTSHELWVVSEMTYPHIAVVAGQAPYGACFVAVVDVSLSTRFEGNRAEVAATVLENVQCRKLRCGEPTAGLGTLAHAVFLQWVSCQFLPTRNSPVSGQRLLKYFPASSIA